MATTASGSGGITPPKPVIIAVGLLSLAVKFAATIFFIWFCILFGIVGYENIANSNDMMQHGIGNLPPYYYRSAFDLTIFTVGIMHVIRQSLHGKLLTFTHDENSEPKQD